jgi:motility quorum-sensing regulator/GCU-specific mRNA interferase toxin
MDKHVMTYDLDAIKQTFSSVTKLCITATATRDARMLGFSRQDIVDAIQQISRADFIKSMTTHADYRIWQDVYNTIFNDSLLYIKFQANEMGYFIISFKECSQ